MEQEKLRKGLDERESGLGGEGEGGGIDVNGGKVGGLPGCACIIQQPAGLRPRCIYLPLKHGRISLKAYPIEFKEQYI